MKKYCKNILVIVIGIVAYFMCSNTYAKEIVYTNKNGMELDTAEYNFFKTVYGEKFLKYLDQDTYDLYSDVDFENPNVQTRKVYSNENGVTRDSNTFFSSPAKSLQISNVCGNLFCRIILTATWLGEPSNKSYDDIGMYLNGPTKLTNPLTTAYSELASNNEYTTKYDPNGLGFGAVIHIPIGEEVVVTQNFIYQGTGTIYGSYQHAMSNSTTTTAQMFNISAIGYGGVFGFYGDALDIYDDMPGVYIDV